MIKFHFFLFVINTRGLAIHLLCHLGCYYLVANVNSAVMNRNVQIPVHVPFSYFGYAPRVELLDSMIVLI